MAKTKPGRGFSLIEQLVAMSAVGGAMALTLPEATALHEAAQTSTLASLAGAAQSAMALNQAGCALTAGRVQPGKCQAIEHCPQISALMLFDLTGHYQLQDAQTPAEPGQLTCTLTQSDTGMHLAFSGPGVPGTDRLAAAQWRAGKTN